MTVHATPRLLVSVALALAAALFLAHLADAGPAPASAGTARLAELAGDVRAAEGHRYDARDDTGRTMDAAQITQSSDGTYLAVYHTLLADGRFHAAVATSADLRHWHRRHDFGPGTHQASLAADGRGGYVLAYEKDPRNHIAVRAYPGEAALLDGRAAHAFDAPRTLSRCAEGTPSISAVRGDTIELTGHYRADCDTDRQLRATLTGFRDWHAVPDRRLDRALRAWGNSGNLGDRAPVELDGQRLLFVEGQRWRGDFGSWRPYAYDPASGRADRIDVSTHGGSRAFANPSATLLTDPRGRPSLLVSVFIPAEGAAPGEAGQLVYWRKL
ncbi:hypothetical protein GCM10010277_39830 [Streptomyces longisporoflavus]|uniref:hypothetical protein n=1 Tax=Streptomyces longisporoflavus TaxID=28044 RepID=UPI00167C8A67|nr:hypothetical protein [Streptomyces longisporoflavus]GGV47479.1 hypothetical protein GCM10010277_39830 [Streptomyces longisporoflavus]